MINSGFLCLRWKPATCWTPCTKQKISIRKMEDTGWRSTERAFNVRLFTPAVQQGRGDADCSCCTWLTSSSSCHISSISLLGVVVAAAFTAKTGARQGQRDQGAAVLLLAHCCSRQHWLFCLGLDLHLVFL